MQPGTQGGIVATAVGPFQDAAFLVLGRHLSASVCRPVERPFGRVDEAQGGYPLFFRRRAQTTVALQDR